MTYLSEEIRSQPLLLVGCGGIGCEVIKNLLLIGFNNIKMIDLDTIDVSNLNRQFLFNSSHVNMSKAIISKNVASDLFAINRKDLRLEAIHGSILESEYNIEFYKNFSFVINALDNRQARSHVNRMCLAADVPLIESGTEGYLGQTFIIKKNVTACYECNGPVSDQKTFASCTIRNTPSLPIHCIVWAKHLFIQLFGEDEDPDNDVSPDMNDPELMNSLNDKENNKNENQKENIKPPSTRKWAENNNYDQFLLFDKLFRIDIEYLHKMDQLWKNRTKPIILKYNQLDVDLPNTSVANQNSQNVENYALQDQKVLSLSECFELFSSSLEKLKQRLKTEQFLVWDKDDEAALEFVTAVSNLRSFCFHIERKSKFDVKSMAGNIIPAISSTNSIIGGLMVLQLMNLSKKQSKLTKEQKSNKKEIGDLYKSTVKHVFLRRVSTNVGNLIASYECFEQNPKCLVCCTKNIPELEVRINFNQVTMCDYVEKFLFEKLNFVCPDIQIDGQPTIIWSKDNFEEYSESEKEEYKTKLITNYPLIKDKVRLKIYDLLQNMSVITTLINEKFNLNENDGLFYKMKITSEVEENNGDEDLNCLSTSETNSSAKNTNCIKIDIKSELEGQETIDLIDNESNSEKFNGNNQLDKSDDKKSGLTNNIKTVESNSSDEIVLIDSDDEDVIPYTHFESVETNNSGCEIIEDDDLELIDVKQMSEKRKIDVNEYQQSIKKLRIEKSNDETV